MSKFKVGDIVYSLMRGVCKVVSIVMERQLAVLDINGDTIIFSLDGRYFTDDLNPTLLTLEEARAKGYNVPKQRVKKTRTAWVNVYPEGCDDVIYSCLLDAEILKNSKRVACVEVTYEYEEEV